MIGVSKDSTFPEPRLKTLTNSDTQSSKRKRTSVSDSYTFRRLLILNMSRPLAEAEDAAQVRDLEVREYMEQMNARNHPVFSLKPLCDNKTGQWFQPPENMLVSVLPESSALTN